jgi:hypothetical protein
MLLKYFKDVLIYKIKNKTQLFIFILFLFTLTMFLFSSFLNYKNHFRYNNSLVMAEWKNIDNEKLDPAFAAIRSLFLDGTIDSLYKLIDYSPTKVASLFSMSYRTYHDKLKEPWKFSLLHILVLANVLRIDPEVINSIIQKESEKAIRVKIELYNLKEQKNKGNLIKPKE